jgi:hypothetical protein
MQLSITRTVERCIHRLQDTIHVGREIVIPKTDDTIPLRFQPTRPLLIFRSVSVDVVLGAVQLDHQTRSHAGKVGDIRSDWHLAAEMSSGGFNSAKPLPQKNLSFRRVRT